MKYNWQMHLIVSYKTLSLRRQLLQINIGRVLLRGGSTIHTGNMFIFLALHSERSPLVIMAIHKLSAALCLQLLKWNFLSKCICFLFAGTVSAPFVWEAQSLEASKTLLAQETLPIMHVWLLHLYCWQVYTSSWPQLGSITFSVPQSPSSFWQQFFILPLVLFETSM